MACLTFAISDAPSTQTTPINNPQAPRSLISIPANLELIRRCMFKVEERVRFSAEEWDQYWPFVSNFWNKSAGPYRKKNGNTRQHFQCRLYAKQPRVNKVSKGERRKQARVAISCPKTASRTTYPDGSVCFESTSPSVQHNHTLDHLDSISRPRAFMDAAAREIARGYRPADVFQNIQGRHDSGESAIASVGGRWFTRQDVINAGQRFKEAGEWGQRNAKLRLSTNLVVTARRLTVPVDGLLGLLSNGGTQGRTRRKS